MRLKNREKVFLIRNVAPEKFGGAEIYQLKLAEKLKKVGFCPVILTNSEELLRRATTAKIQTLVPPYCKRQNWSGVFNLGLPFYFLYQLRLRKWYRKTFMKNRPKVVNIQSRDDWLAATLEAKKFGIKTLWTDHADFKNWVLNNVNVKFKNIIGKKIIKYSRYTDKVIFVSKRAEEETNRMISPQKIQNSIVIENGVKDYLRQYKKTNIEDQSFVYVGRVTEEKGIGDLIEAFLEVNKKFKDAKLNIYGGGDIDFFKKIAKGNKNIIFHGEINNSIEVLAKNKFFILPSHMEGLSFALLEAAMMQKSIIATDVGGNSEVVVDGKTGILVPSGKPEILAKKMIFLLENPKKAEAMAVNVRKIFEEKFDLDKIFNEKMLPLYKEEEK